MGGTGTCSHVDRELQCVFDKLDTIVVEEDTLHIEVGEVLQAGHDHEIYLTHVGQLCGLEGQWWWCIGR